jgi:hypothetical protein
MQEYTCFKTVRKMVKDGRKSAPIHPLAEFDYAGCKAMTGLR